MFTGKETVLHVTNIDKNANEMEMQKHFAKKVNIKKLTIVGNNYHNTGKYAFARAYFDNESDALEAIFKFSNTPFLSRNLQISLMDIDKKRRESGEGNLFLRYIDASADTRILYATFQQFGKIYSTKLQRTDKGAYAFIQFYDVSAASKSIASVKIIRETHVFRHVKIEKYVPKKKTRKYNLYVKYLGNWTEVDLNNYFSQFGAIDNTIVMKDRNGISKKFGFVTFTHMEDGLKALRSEHVMIINNKCKKLYVREAIKKSERKQQIETRYLQMKAKRKERNNLIVQNIGAMTLYQLKKIFEKYGEIAEAKVIFKNGHPQGYGFVCFKDKVTAANAMTSENNRFASLGYKIIVRLANIPRSVTPQKCNVPLMMHLPMNNFIEPPLYNHYFSQYHQYINHQNAPYF
ncbi:hypothetical protein A3Q56_07554 [Intoshia linei]|uniref:RRM domain-containing protein n=1 Tax=Intoshia linei TaxID=1819745 RepID=A0A177ATJ0_9BILA|nr:hypothetical protein A3Q56_07554 [Intoshia linei]